MSKITVLGASGFIGSHLVNKLRERGANYDAPHREENLTGRNLGTVIYCIGLTADFRIKPFETVEAHVCRLQRILQECSFDSLTYLSSTRLYKSQHTPAREEDAIEVNPTDADDLYNISKAMGEALMFACGKETRVVRISNVYGADFASDNFLSTIIRDAVSAKEVVVRTAPGSEKDYIGINDVTEGLIRIATGGRHRIYNLASGENMSNREIMSRLSSLTGCSVRFAPGAARTSFPQINIDRMREEFGFEPASLLAEMDKLVELFKGQLGGLH